MRRLVLPLASLILTLGVAACSDDEQPAVDAPAAIDAGADAPGPRLCGGFAGAVCGADQYCDFARNGCGATDEQGVCTPRPTDCPDLLVAIPSCGCDGTVYGSPCEAYAAGADLSASGGCPVANGSFACGYTQCSLRNDYCQRQLSDVVDEPDGFVCRPVTNCPSEFPTCACLAGEPCGAACSGVGATGLTLTCPGG